MIVVKNLSIQVGSFSLKDIDFEIPKGCYCMLMGKTGSGKTTLLEVLAGLKYATSGQISFHGRDVTRLRPSERGIGYVPQDGALFPTMSVRDNLAFALKVRRANFQAIDRRVDELAELLSIKDLLSRMPLGLSGGERQRVALGRALAFKPEILLLDEPLSALDDETRRQMWDVLRRVRDHTGVTAFHVTHNRDDAKQLADLLFLIEQGQLRETPITNDAPAPDASAHEASTQPPEPQEETTP